MSLRDFDVNDIVFTDINGKSYSIKDMREYPTYTTWFKYDLQQGDSLEEIASSMGVYGSGQESEYYKIAEHNIKNLFDAQFDLSRLKSINIPLQ